MSYVTDVTDLFLARFPNITILNPLDYVVVSEWEKQEIPLSIVLGSINDVSEKLDGENSKIESIGYFQETVKKNFHNWLQTQGGEKAKHSQCF